jgi:hypothetical protein
MVAKGAVACACVLAASLPALAAPRSLVALDFDAPAGCPSREAILSAIDRLVQKAPLEPLRVQASIEPADGRWTLRITVEGGQRLVIGDSCAALSQTLVVILALAVDPEARVNVAAFPEVPAGPAAPPPESLADVPSDAALAPPRAPAPVPVPTSAAIGRSSVPPRRPIRFGASLLLLGEAGMLPKPSFGANAAARVGAEAWALQLSGQLLAPAFAQLPHTTARIGGNVSWLGAELAGCWSPFRQDRFAGCLGVEAGQLSGTGRGVEHRETGHALWLAGTFGVVVRSPISARFAIETRLGVAVPALRPWFGLKGYGQLFRPDAASGRALVGIAWR